MINLSENIEERVARLARELASNEETVRLSAFKKLSKGLEMSIFSPKDYPFLWNGLYYMYYHSDTMRKQNALAKQISTLRIEPFKAKKFKDINSTLEWLKNSFIILKKRWNTIDYNRMNKFMYLARMLISQALNYIQDSGFKKTVFTGWNKIINEQILNENMLERGLMLHIVQLYPSIATKLKFKNVIQVFFCFKPVFDVLAFTKSKVLRKQISEKISDYFVEFCRDTLNPDAQAFVRKKLMGYATAETIDGPPRKTFYSLIQLYDLFMKTQTTKEDPDSLIGMKKKISKKKKKKAPKKANKKIPQKNKKKAVNSKVKEKKAKKKTVQQRSVFEELTNPSKKAPENNAQDFGLKKKTSQELNFSNDDKDDNLAGFLSPELERILMMNEEDILPEEFFQISESELQELEAMQDPYEDVNIDELRKKLPAYYYMGPREKKNYFKKITKKYMKKMRKGIKPGKKRLRFDLPSIRVKKFAKQQIVPKKKLEVESKTKGILKKKN